MRSTRDHTRTELSQGARHDHSNCEVARRQNLDAPCEEELRERGDDSLTGRIQLEKIRVLGRSSLTVMPGSA